MTLLASKSLSRMGPCIAVKGATTGAVFEAHLEIVLAPSLRPGQVVAMDNLSSRNGSRVIRKRLEKQGCEPRYLPSYSPNLNPIEEAAAELETSLRRVGTRTFEALVETMGRALDENTYRDASGFWSSPRVSVISSKLGPFSSVP